MTDTEYTPRTIRRSLYESPRGYGWRARVAWFVLHFGCRHGEGVICRHRQYEYDHWLAGSHAGYRSGLLYERDHARPPVSVKGAE